jgi:hypothetical protein
MNIEKYSRGYFMPPVKSLKWTEREYITESPAWCSVDLRDGNQALVVPMSLEEKLEFPIAFASRFQGNRSGLSRCIGNRIRFFT